MHHGEAIPEDIVAETTQHSGSSDHRTLSPVQPLALLASFETPRSRQLLNGSSRRASSTDDAKSPTSPKPRPQEAAAASPTSPKPRPQEAAAASSTASPAANRSPGLSLSVLANLSTKTGRSQFFF
jgi:hypothetical protein